MKVHEYQAKAILREFGVPVPRGEVADTAGEARAIARHTLGMRLKTPQMPPEREPHDLVVRSPGLVALPIRRRTNGPFGEREFVNGIVQSSISERSG